MPLIINHITSSAIKINYSYLDTEFLFGYEVVADYTVSFSDSHFTDQEGVLWAGQEALKQAYLQQNLVARIGTDEFLNGRITSLSFGSSALVGENEAKITIEESRALTAEKYEDNPFVNKIPSPQWLSSFQENHSFSRSADNYSYKRDVSIQYKQDAGDKFMESAREFLREYYENNRPNIGYQEDGISEEARIDGGLKTLITETYDLLNLRVSLSESFDSSSIDTFKGKKCSIKKSLVEDILESGFTEKKYTIEIQVLEEPLEENILESSKEVIDDIEQEDQDFHLFSIEKTFNKDGGIMSMNLSLSNDPRKNHLESWYYSASSSFDSQFTEYSVSMEFSARKESPNSSWNGTKSLWKSKKAEDKPLLSNFFETSDFFEKTASVSFSKPQNKITQNTVYTTDDSYDPEGLPDGIIKQTYSSSESLPIDRHEIIWDYDSKKEFLISDSKKQLKNGSLSKNIVYKTSRGESFGNDNVREWSPDLTDKYITSDVISMDTIQGTASRVIQYVEAGA